MINKEALDRFLQRTLLWFVFNVLALAVLIVIQFVTIDSRSQAQTEILELVSSVLVGTLVSFLFYLIVVFLPQKQRRNRLRKNFLERYLSIKEALLWQIVFASKAGGRQDLEEYFSNITPLMDVKVFRQTFSGGREANEGWYAFCNYMNKDSDELREILLSLSQLRLQVDHILMQDVFEQQGLLNFFSWLNTHLLRLENTEVDDWEKRPLVGFLYQLLSGWHPIEGYRDYDYVERQAAFIL